MSKVCVIQPFTDDIGFYRRNGWTVSLHPEKDADLFHFCGGEDLNPSIYGQEPIQGTHFNPHRDRIEQIAFGFALKHGIPMVGFCRGLQLINALAGGDMYQDVNNHAGMGKHSITIRETYETMDVISVHHQVVIPPDDAIILAEAEGEWTYRRYWDRQLRRETCDENPNSNEAEIVYYPEVKGFGVQSHPEWMPSESRLVTYTWENIQKLLDMR